MSFALRASVCLTLPRSIGLLSEHYQCTNSNISQPEDPPPSRFCRPPNPNPDVRRHRSQTMFVFLLLQFLLSFFDYNPVNSLEKRALRITNPSILLTADIVQDLYLNGIKAYKPAPLKANDHEGQVRNWATPSTPSVPDLGDASLTADITTYQSQVVETETGAPDASPDAPAATTKATDDWFDEEAAFAEEKDAHH
ncbi:hypothetical protein ABW20_dc0106630 [Dactylellina cionopaga]|nr:hypothetical protein ABW20_dc0106630 [Dactylellina cionopaga]